MIRTTIGTTLRRTLTGIAAGLGLALLGGVAAPPAALANESPEVKFQKMDSNGDGRISADEHSTGAREKFFTMDTDRDGKVTAAEMTAAHERMGGGDKARHSGMSVTDKIKQVDTDGDGALTVDEHAAGAQQKFDLMDADKNGTLTKSEVKAGHVKLHPKASSK